MIPRSLRRERLVCFAQAVALWLVLAYSVGWYHSITRLGVRGWPIPSPESLASFAAYATTLSKWQPPYEAVWWFALFPVAGWLWVALLCMTSGYFNGQQAGIMLTCRPFALATAPFALLGPLVTYFVWRDHGVLRGLYLTAARFGMVEPEPWLGPAYLVLGAISLVAQIVIHRRLFAVQGGKAVAHFGVNLIVAACVMAGIAVLLREASEIIQRMI